MATARPGGWTTSVCYLLSGIIGSYHATDQHGGSSPRTLSLPLLPERDRPECILAPPQPPSGAANSPPSSRTLVSLSGTGSVATSPLTVNPTSLRFAGQAGSSTLRPASVSITNAGAGSLALTGASDQPWPVLSAAPGEQRPQLSRSSSLPRP